MGCLLIFQPGSSKFWDISHNEATRFIPSTHFHLTQVVMHSCKREEMPMFGQSRTELPAATSEHHDQDHPHPITSVSSLIKCYLHMFNASLKHNRLCFCYLLHWTTDWISSSPFLSSKKTKEPMAWRCSTNQMIDPCWNQKSERSILNHLNATSPYIYCFTHGRRKFK